MTIFFLRRKQNTLFRDQNSCFGEITSYFSSIGENPEKENLLKNVEIRQLQQWEWIYFRFVRMTILTYTSIKIQNQRSPGDDRVEIKNNTVKIEMTREFFQRNRSQLEMKENFALKKYGSTRWTFRIKFFLLQTHAIIEQFLSKTSRAMIQEGNILITKTMYAGSWKNKRTMCK